ncbi:MAG: hypothetical protein WC373_14870 [Smithella sp.]|jgi:hypothetical protein
MENELVVYDDNVPAIADDSLLRVAQQAEQRIDAVIKIKKMALKVTNPRDWTDQGGNPYLQVSGAEKIANLFNISWRIDEPICETEDDGHFTFTYVGTFTIPGRSIQVTGSRSSKDPFFKKYEWNNGVKTEKPISAIDRRDVKMAAMTNLLGNGITRLLGIRNLTYNDLTEFANIDKEQIGKVEYKGKNGDKPPVSAPQKKGDADPLKISEAQKKRFYAIAKNTGYSDDEIKAHLLTLGIEHTADILKSQYDELCAWAEGKNREPGTEG